MSQRSLVSQRSLFDFDTRTGLDLPVRSRAGEKAAQEGAKAACSNAEAVDDTWPRRAQGAALGVLAARGEVTSEDVLDACPAPKGTDPRAVGHVLRGLALDGKIARLRIEKARRSSRHSGLVTVWGPA